MEKINKVKKIYKLSPMQQGMLFHTISNPNTNMYMGNILLTIMGELDVEIFEKSFNILIERHDVLRTVFAYDNLKDMMQIVLKERQGKVDYIDISQLGKDEKISYIEEYLKKFEKVGFDLKKDILLKFTIFKVDSEEYKVLMNNHHIIIDGWCLGIILEEVFKIYNEYKFGVEAKLMETYPYSDFIEWIDKQDKEQCREYWETYLDGYRSNMGIPFKRLQSTVEFSHKEIDLKFDRELTKKLEYVAKENKVTINSIVQSIWSIQLKKYTNLNDLVFGHVVSGRNPEIVGSESMMGLFINTIPVRVQFHDGITYKEVVNKISDEFLESMKYEYYPLAEIQNLSEQKSKLINHIMVFENYAIYKEKLNSEVICKSDFEIADVKVTERTSYDFNIEIAHGNDMLIRFIFNDKVYKEEHIKLLSNHFYNIVKAIVESENVVIDEIDIIGEDERKKLLLDFNDTSVDYPKDKTVHLLFEDQVKKIPKNIAVKCNDASLTYEELNSRANKLARVLRKHGVSRNAIVGIMMERSVDMLVSIIATLKAGGAYLPIDVEYPKERINYMLQDSNASVLLTNSKFINEIEGNALVLNIEAKEINEEDGENLEFINNTNDLAYIIFTSGSTGNPKGAMVHQLGMLNHTLAKIKELDLNEECVVSQNSSHCFDISVWQFLAGLCVGGKVVIYPKDVVVNVEKFIDSIEKDEITILEVVPTYLGAMLDNIEKRITKFGALKYLIATGEALNAKLVKRWFDSYEHVKIVNAYGPTEASDDITHHVIDKPCETDVVSIGKPIQNLSIYIVDKNMKLCPIGVVGELCVSGIGVGPGYINNEEKTKQVFMEDPFSKIQGVRLYKTGDLARWDIDGTIEFFGRKDYQVKIRGFRIELGEIENRILKYEGVKEVVVIDKTSDNGEKFLCAYLTCDTVIDNNKLRQHLKQTLPDYMIPAYFVQMNKIPVNDNGKIDRKVLPEPDKKIGMGTSYEAPINDIEEALASIWCEILSIKKVGSNDNFFDLGGHSLKATSMASMIRKRMNVEVSLREIFNLGTIKLIGEYIQTKEKSEYYSIEKIEESKYYEAASAQKRMYMLQQFDKNSVTFNITGAFEMEGNLDISKVETRIKELIKRHESLRTSFEEVDKKIVQRIHEFKDIHFSLEKINKPYDVDVDILIDLFIRPFDVAKAPLLRSGIIKGTEGKNILIFDIHHIIADGETMAILAKEFSDIYSGKVLEPLNIQYKEYSHWHNKFMRSDEYKKQEEYWLNEFKHGITIVDVPTDFERPRIKMDDADTYEFFLGKDMTIKLKKLAQKTGTTLNMVLMSIFKILLAKYSNKNDIVIGSAIAGRNHNELENVVGVFINTLVLKSTIREEDTFENYLGQLKEKTLKAFENQEYQFEDLISKLKLPKDLSRNPLIDFMFIMQNTKESRLDINDITLKTYDLKSKTEKFDMSMIAYEVDEAIYIVLSYAKTLFKKKTIEIFVKNYIEILNQVVMNSKIKLSDLKISNDFEVMDKITLNNDFDF